MLKKTTENMNIIIGGKVEANLLPISRRLGKVLEKWNFDIETTSEGILSKIKKGHYDVIVLEDCLADTTAQSLCEEIRNSKYHPDIYIIVFGPIEDEKFTANVLKAGADDILRKPFYLSELITRLRSVSRLISSEVTFNNTESFTGDEQFDELLMRRESILEAVNYAAAHFLEDTDWEDSVPHVLSRLAISTGACRVYACQNTGSVEESSQPRLNLLHEWTADGIACKFNPTANKTYEDLGLTPYLSNLRHNQVVIASCSSIPPELIESNFAKDVKSFILVPIFVNSEWWGIIGFDSCHEDKKWSSTDIDALTTAARIFGTGIHRKTVQDSLRGNLQFLETFLDTIPSPAFYQNGSGIFMGCNAAFSQMVLGLSKRDIMGNSFKDFHEVVPPQQAEYLHQKDVELMETPGYQTFEASFLCSDGVERTFLFDKTTFLNDIGEVVGICGVMSDITDLKTAESELNSARQREINIGFEIQNRLLLTTPPQELSGAEVAAISIPSHQIDGDFYDFIRYDTTHFDLVLGDVMGKGVSAAMLGAATKTQFLRSVTNLVCSTNLATLPTPEEILSFIHRSMSEKLMSLNSFVTMCCARFYLDLKRMDLVDCGHTKTIHYRAKTDEFQYIKSNNLPLGFSTEEVYTQHSVHLEIGDVLLFYSDGLIETKNADDEDYGSDRLVQFISQNHHLPSQQIVQKLYSELIHYSASVTFSDDLTYIVVKISEPKDNTLLLKTKKQILSNLEELEPLRTFIDETLLKHANVDVKFLSQLELALSEATSNIIKHAYKREKNRPIDVILELYQDQVIIFLNHWGEGLDDFQLITPAFDGSQVNGYGLYLIRNCVDEVNYSTDHESKQATVRLAKRIKSQRSLDE